MSDVQGAPQTPVAPALGISIQCTAGTSQLVFQTHVAQETDKVGIDTLVDRLVAVAERQTAKAELPQMRKLLRKEKEELVRMRANRDAIEERLKAPQDGRRNQNRIDEAKLAQDRANADATEKRYLETIGRFEEDIAAAEAVVAGT